MSWARISFTTYLKKQQHGDFQKGALKLKLDTYLYTVCTHIHVHIYYGEKQIDDTSIFQL